MNKDLHLEELLLVLSEHMNHEQKQVVVVHPEISTVQMPVITHPSQRV